MIKVDYISNFVTSMRPIMEIINTIALIYIAFELSKLSRLSKRKN